jgi:hypothetical protein
MPNAIKYSTTGDTLSLKKGNIFFGVGDVGKGPSSATTYYNGVSPVTSGYTIYSYNVNQTSKLSFFTAVNDSALITYTNGVSGQNFSTATQCLNWYVTQSNYVCVNRDYEGIVTNGLVLNVDAGFTPSYTSSGNTWYDLSYNGNNGTLTNGPTFNSSNGGSLVFDGIDDYVSCGNSSSVQIYQGTISAWVKTPSPGSSYRGIITKQGNYGLFIRDGELATYDWGNNQNITTGINIADNTWKNVSMTFTTNTGSPSNNAIIYLNGSAVLTTTIKYSVNNVELQLGNGGNAEQYISGSIATGSVYNRALTSSEVLQNYNAQVSRFSASYDSDAQAFFTAAGITDTTQQNAINTLVVGLKTDGLWTSMQAIYPFVGGTATTHKWNLRNTATNQLTFFGGFTHDSNGVTGNGTNSYATTNIYNSATLGIYSRSSNPTGAFVGKRKANEPVEGSQYNITESSLFGNVYNGNNGQYNLGASPYNKFYNVSNGVTGAANEVKVYRNGTNVVLSSSAGATPPSSANEYYLFANPNEITFDDTGQTRIDIYDNSNANIALALFSNTTLDATQNTNLNNRVVTFQTALSRNV